MKTVIFCGGLGTRLAEETDIRPKPMVNIGDNPILWHIMNIYGAQGFDDFILPIGYKGEYIKDYFLKYSVLSSDFSVELRSGKISQINKTCKRDWKVDLISTGVRTQTGGRLKRLEARLRPHGSFMLTYGDGVADINLKELLAFHKKHGKLATITAVRPTARFGGLQLEGNKVKLFQEKPQSGEGWINGGFFVMEPEIFDYLDDDTTVLETSPMARLVKDKQLAAYKHEGFWQCMDTLREKQLLEALWSQGKAPWKMWDED
jgi:glucose-1-phosphate cytidylyltransferase